MKRAVCFALEGDKEPLMDNKLAALINLAKHLPEKRLNQAIETLEKMKGEAEREEEQQPLDCPHCRAERASARKAAIPLPGMRKKFRADDRDGAVQVAQRRSGLEAGTPGHG